MLCLSCSSKNISVVDSNQGRKVTCKDCQHIEAVPAKFTCYCGKSFDNPGQYIFLDLCSKHEKDPRCLDCNSVLEAQVGHYGREIMHYCAECMAQEVSKSDNS